MISFQELLKLFPLELEEEKVTAHIKRAELDFKQIDLRGHEDLELEIIGSKTLYYLAPLLWVNMQNRVDEYEQSLQTFKDIRMFQEYWLKRSNEALALLEAKKQRGLTWASV